MPIKLIWCRRVMAKSAERNHMRYKVYKDNKGEWRWRLLATNNRVLADSGEGYKNKQDCLQGIELVKRSFATPVEEE